MTYIVALSRLFILAVFVVHDSCIILMVLEASHRFVTFVDRFQIYSFCTSWCWGLFVSIYECLFQPQRGKFDYLIVAMAFIICFIMNLTSVQLWWYAYKLNIMPVSVIIVMASNTLNSGYYNSNTTWCEVRNVKKQTVWHINIYFCYFGKSVFDVSDWLTLAFPFCFNIHVLISLHLFIWNCVGCFGM